MESVISHQKSGELLSQLHPALQALVASLPDTLSLELVVFRGRLVARQIIINGVKVGHYDDPHGRSQWQLSAERGSVILGTPVWGGPKGECRVLASLAEVSASVATGKALDCALQPVPEKKPVVEALVRLRIR